MWADSRADGFCDFTVFEPLGDKLDASPLFRSFGTRFP
jgi:hypothetical protein